MHARKRGMSLGRPKGMGKSKLDKHKVEIQALLNNGSTKTWIANTYGTTVGNLTHWMKLHGVVKGQQPGDTKSRKKDK